MIIRILDPDNFVELAEIVLKSYYNIIVSCRLANRGRRFCIRGEA